MKVLITGMRAPVALDLARAFLAAGHEAHLADSIHGWAAAALMPSARRHRFPAPARDFAGFAAVLARLIERHDFALIVPTCEEVFWLAAAAARNGWTDRLFAPDLSLLRRLHSKAAFPGLLAECGIPAPETLLLTAPPEPDDLPPLASLVFKPEFSRFSTHTLISPQTRALAKVNASPKRRWLAQRRIHGQELCSWALLREGRLVAHVAYRPRWRHGIAAAYAMETVDCPALEAMARQLGTATGMTGQIAFDSIMDEQGQVWPVECNPRAVSGLHLFDASADLAKAIACGRPIASPEPGLLRHMAPAMAILGIPAAAADGRLASLLADWRAGRDVIARGHGGVMMGCLADAARFATLAAVRRMSPAGATTDGIEWDGDPIT